MNSGLYGFSHILDVVRATSVKVLGKAGATAGAALAGGTASGAPTAPAGPFDVGDVIVDATGKLWICTTAGTSQSSPGSFTQVGGTASPLTTKGDVWVYGSTDARLGVGGNGQVITADSTQSLGLKWGTPGAASGGALSQIGTQTLTGTAASIDFSSIAGTYAHLLLELQLRSTSAGANTTLQVRFNGDTAANYDAQFAQAFNNNTVGGGDSIAATSMLLAYMTTAAAAAGAASTHTLHIPNYAGTTFRKNVQGSSAVSFGDSAVNTNFFGMAGFWRSTAAITSISLFPAAGSFAAGCVATLYGVS